MTSQISDLTINESTNISRVTQNQTQSRMLLLLNVDVFVETELSKCRLVYFIIRMELDYTLINKNNISLYLSDVGLK